MVFLPAVSLNLAPIVYIIQTFGDILLRIAPGAIVLSMAVSAVVWVFAGTSEKMVRFARNQFVATLVTTAIIAGYFIFKIIVLKFAMNGFGV